MSTLNATSKPESARIAGHLQYAGSLSIITNALVAANATITALCSAIEAAANHTTKTIAMQTSLALKKAKALGLVSETHGLTTVAGFTALMDAPSTTYKDYFNK